MKKLLASALIFVSFGASAGQYDWKTELAEFKANLETATSQVVWQEHTKAVFVSVAGCTISTVLSGSAYIADSLPLTNPIAEFIGNETNSNYQSYQALLEWENLGAAGRGTLGGARVAVLEALEYVQLWAGHNEDESFQATSKVYASTLATLDAMFAEQSQCMMGMSKVMMARQELFKRGELTPTRWNGGIPWNRK